MSIAWRPTLLALAVSAATLPQAWATNGYFAHGYSASQRALGGAGTAYAADALAITINPAASARVGKRIDGNLSFFAPTRFVEAGQGNPNGGVINLAAGNTDSSQNLFLIPGFAFVTPLSEQLHGGIAIYGNGGLNTVYKLRDSRPAQFGNFMGGSFSCDGLLGGGAGGAPVCGNGVGTASVDLTQLFVAPNLSYQLNDTWSVGVSPLLAVQRFEAKGLGAFKAFSNSPDRVTDNGNDYSYGAGVRLGVHGSPLSWLEVGASYQSRVAMSRFKDYEGLFAGQGDFDIPESWNVGVQFKPAAGHRILVDYQRLNFGDTASVGGSFNPDGFINNCALPRFGGSTAASPNCLGADRGPGFGWNHMSVVKLGYEYTRDKVSYRVGYSKTQQPIDESEALFNVLAPGVVEEHFTAGIGVQATRHWGFDASLMVAPTNTVRGRNPLSAVQGNPMSPPVQAGVDPADQTLDLSMRQVELTLGVSYTF